MGTRSAPFVFLLLTACMAVDGIPTAMRGGSAPDRNPPAATPARPVFLPAIPRMRPDAPRRLQTAKSPVQTDVAMTAEHRHDTDAAGATPPADPAERGDGTGPRGDKSDMVLVEPNPQSDGPRPGEAGSAAADAGHAILAEDEGSFESIGATSGAEPAPDSAGAAVPSGGVDGNADEAGPGADTEFDLAALAPQEESRGIDVESLFDGDVVRYCAAMRQMGEYIGAARLRGEPFKQAIGDSVRRIANEKQLPLDNRLAFSGQVYGRLVYRLENSHGARILGTYVHFACLTVRGDKKIVPADPDAERLLNDGLAFCERTAFTREDLNDCIFRELTPVVDRRNG